MANTTQASDRERRCVDWAAPTLTMRGATLYPETEGWTVELPDGSWASVSNGFELGQLAYAIQNKRDVPPEFR